MIVWTWLLCLAIAGPPSQEPSPPKSVAPCVNIFVRSPAEFADHTRRHVRRVVILGMKVFQEYAGEFSGVDRELLLKFLRLHDHEKFDPKRLEALYRIYGNWDGYTAAERASALLVINDVRRADERFALRFFEEHGLARDGLLLPSAAGYLRIERIADRTDTRLSIARGEELGRKGESPPIETYIHNPRDIQIAKDLEPYYFSLVANDRIRLFETRDKVKGR